MTRLKTIPMTKLMKNLVTILLLTAVLSGCTILPESDPVQLLDPQVPEPAAAERSADWTLNIARPEADPVRDSTRVLIRTGQGQLQVHASARWVAAAPELVRTLLVRHLRDSNRLRQVSAGAAGQDRTLALDLRRFELNEIGADRLETDIRIEARLYDSRSSELVARRVFEGRQAADSAQPARILSGFETVLGEIIPGMVDWVADQESPATQDR